MFDLAVVGPSGNAELFLGYAKCPSEKIKLVCLLELILLDTYLGGLGCNPGSFSKLPLAEEQIELLHK